MIRLDFCYKSETYKNKVIDDYYNSIKKDTPEMKKLDEWCRTNLSDVEGDKFDTIEKVIKAKPTEIKMLVKYFNSIDKQKFFETLYKPKKHKTSDKSKGTEEEEENKKSCYIINQFKSMSKEIRRSIISAVGQTVCPYCNRNYIITDSDVNTAQLDHFFSKTDYPILALSFYNLIPSCQPCNYNKGTKKLSFYPYDTSDENEMLNFSYVPTAADYLTNKNSLLIKADPTDKKYVEQIDAFCLQKLYSYHNDIVLDILQKQFIFSNAYLSALQKDFPDLIPTVDSVKELVFGVPLTKENRSNRPLSKLTQDIMNIDNHFES